MLKCKSGFNATAGFSTQSTPAPCHQNFQNVEPRNAEMPKFHSKGESTVPVASQGLLANDLAPSFYYLDVTSTVQIQPSIADPIVVVAPSELSHLLSDLEKFQVFKGLDLFSLCELNSFGYRLHSRNAIPPELCQL
jgi:hypothetical protein